MYSYEEAVSYFENEVLHNKPWLDADETTRQRALKNAENILYSYFKRFNPETNPIPNKAIFEQALWLLRFDDAVQRAELGVSNINMSGEISLSFSGGADKIAPNAKMIIGAMRKVGRYSP
jgi:hypothetical protein